MASPSLTEEAFEVIWKWHYSTRRTLIAEEFAINEVASKVQTQYRGHLDAYFEQVQGRWPDHDEVDSRVRLGILKRTRVLLRTLLLEHGELRRAANIINPTRFNQSTARSSREERTNDLPRYTWPSDPNDVNGGLSTPPERVD